MTTPLSPKEWMRQRDEAIGPKLSTVIGEINLVIKAAEKTPIYIQASRLGIGRVQDQAVEEFRKLGWRVTFHGDQRDGDFYSFEC
jgi:hypothetical protein